MHSKRRKQLAFFDEPKKEFGGTLLKNTHARGKRPLCSKRSLHLILKTENACLKRDARGVACDRRLFKKRQEILALLQKKREQYSIRLHSYFIGANHIHLHISLTRRQRYFAWIRSVTGLIARLFLQAEKGRPSGERFWTHRPFTRIVEAGRDFFGLQRYIEKNELEFWAGVRYRPRATYAEP